MSKAFTRTYRAGYSEINANGLLVPAHYARCIIDTAYELGEIMGPESLSNALKGNLIL